MESIYEIMSEKGAAELLKHMRSYNGKPMFVKTKLGCAMFIPAFASACTLGILVLPCFGGDKFYRVVKYSKYKIAASEELTVGKRCRMCRSATAVKDKCISLMEQLTNAFGDICTIQFVKGDVTQLLEQKIYDLSHYCACPVEVICDTPLVATTDFDYALFSAFVFICMTLTRRSAEKSELTVTLTCENSTVSVLASIPMGAAEQVQNSVSIQKFRKIAKRKSMDFDCFCASHVLHIRFSPHVFDRNELGFRSPRRKRSARKTEENKNKE